MPAFMQWLSHINPMTYYLIVIRGTFLKGVGLSVLWPQMLALAALGFALLAMSAQVPQIAGLGPAGTRSCALPMRGPLQRPGIDFPSKPGQ
jgi:hypothetical protein